MRPDLKVERDLTQEIDTLVSSIMALPDQTEGLQLDRIAEFSVEMGASEKPLKYLALDDFETARVISRESARIVDAEGLYTPTLGVMIVKRNTDLELLNGTAITESITIHEKAHATHLPTPLRATRVTTGRFLRKRTTVNVEYARSGFGVSSFTDEGNDFGRFLEEGYAEYERGLFVKRHGLIDDFSVGAANLSDMQKIPIPMKYLFKRASPDGTPMLIFAPGALAATVMDKLVEHNPEYLQIMREARQTPDGLRKFIVETNKFSPKLYSRLMHADQDEAMAKLVGEVVRSKHSPLAK